jgi:Spy/CpxP family protein refolding chaperone
MAMRTLSVLFSSMLGIWVCAGPVATGNTQEKNTQGKRERVRERMMLVIQDLNLTDEQESKIKDIQNEFRPKVEEASKNLRNLVKEEMDKVHTILTPEQREKLQALKEERRERRAERLSERLAHFEDLDLTDAEVTKIEEICKETRPKIEKALEALDGILTEEQQKARDEAIKAGKPRREIMESLKLTEDQKKIVMSACKELTAAVHQEMGKIKEVLTEQQQAKLQELQDVQKDHVRDRRAHRVANSQDINLTDEQKSKITEVRKEFHPKIHEAGNKLRGVIRDEVDAIEAAIKG